MTTLKTAILHHSLFSLNCLHKIQLKLSLILKIYFHTGRIPIRIKKTASSHVSIDKDKDKDKDNLLGPYRVS